MTLKIVIKIYLALFPQVNDHVSYKCFLNSFSEQNDRQNTTVQLFKSNDETQKQ